MASRRNSFIIGGSLHYLSACFLFMHLTLFCALVGRVDTDDDDNDSNFMASISDNPIDCLQQNFLSPKYKWIYSKLIELVNCSWPFKQWYIESSMIEKKRRRFKYVTRQYAGGILSYSVRGLYVHVRLRMILTVRQWHRVGGCMFYLSFWTQFPSIFTTFWINKLLYKGRVAYRPITTDVV